MVDSGIYEWVRTNGDHAILRWEPPADHDSDARTVPVPLHDEIGTGTLERVIESLPREAAGFGNCVHQLQRPARRSFG
ncbi:type II toxin-antitoxin system HicA family toxin [Halosimplex salinum]|uniref:type II toxin-antitoxin system HicA family toxin n=1 Tax=Halosimplex salinum TaxID=1710538 RepID=UPI001F1E1362|nr:type II toxin-antitoxin system HicA family toxin [Halosimplex salinum]